MASKRESCPAAAETPPKELYKPNHPSKRSIKAKILNALPAGERLIGLEAWREFGTSRLAVYVGFLLRDGSVINPEPLRFLPDQCASLSIGWKARLMPSNDRVKVKGRSESGEYMTIPYAVLTTKKYRALSGRVCKLFLDAYIQYHGRNNGDIQCTWKYMKPLGWRSKGTLHSALIELIRSGFLILSRQGGRNHCALYAVSRQKIDECLSRELRAHKLDIRPTKMAPGGWKDEQKPYPPSDPKSPVIRDWVLDQAGSR